MLLTVFFVVFVVAAGLTGLLYAMKMPLHKENQTSQDEMMEKHNEKVKHEVRDVVADSNQ